MRPWANINQSIATQFICVAAVILASGCRPRKAHQDPAATAAPVSAASASAEPTGVQIVEVGDITSDDPMAGPPVRPHITCAQIGAAIDEGLGKSDKATGEYGAARRMSATPLALAAQPARISPPAIYGKWDPPKRWLPPDATGPYVVIHLSVLPDGRLLTWSPPPARFGEPDPDSPNAYTWDPKTGEFVHVPLPGTYTFCGGHSVLPSGDVFATGGTIGQTSLQVAQGSRRANIFHYRTNQWDRTYEMNAGRWYPTNVTLPNGEVLVASGLDEEANLNPVVQIFSETTYRWRTLSNVSMKRYAELYPLLFVMPNGKVFGAGPNQSTFIIDPLRAGTFAWGPKSLYGTRNHGSSVSYRPGVVMIVGGAARVPASTPRIPVTNTAEIIDLNKSPLAWRYVAPMRFARQHHNATVLPDGTVLVTGGTGAGIDPRGPTQLDMAIYPAEVWDPATNKWSTLASMTVPRMYHSVAALLTDGRVIASGGGYPTSGGEAPDGNHDDYEIFSPPYLFKGPRPTIRTAPRDVLYGKAFTVTVAPGADVGRVTLVRLSSVTHGVNMSQNFYECSFKISGLTLTVTGPAQPALATPGPYMLHVLSKKGVPSVAKVVFIKRA